MTITGHIDPDALDRSLSALRPRSSDDGLMDALRHVMNAACELFTATGAGFMMLDDSQVLCAVAATDAAGRLMEELQQAHGRGPCVDAATLDRITTTSDLAADERWPQLVPQLPDAGVRAVLGIPIRANGVVVGSLNVYRNEPHEWDDSDIHALASYGLLIEALMRAALQAREREELTNQLQHALNSRVVIERAVGVIMAQQQITAVDAFNFLRGQARRTEQKAAAVAAQVLDDVTRAALNRAAEGQD